MNLSAPEGFFQVANRARFELRGPDAIRYLNGQVSIDITRLSPGKARPACLLTPKGKLCAPLQIWCQSDSLIIEGPAELGEIIQARLERYIIADDVELLPIDLLQPIYHLLAPAQTNAQEGPAGHARSDAHNLAINRIGIAACDTSKKPGAIPEFSPGEIELLRIIHGVPLWGCELTEDTLPPEARLEERAVDFNKGCYVGQETVSRLKSVGRVNKRLHGFLGASDLPVGVFLSLRPAGDAATTAGQLTSHTRHFVMAQTVALGYLNRQFESLPSFEVADETGRVLGEVERREFPIL
jgi:folate-binding protein YgfZ